MYCKIMARKPVFLLSSPCGLHTVTKGDQSNASYEPVLLGHKRELVKSDDS